MLRRRSLGLCFAALVSAGRARAQLTAAREQAVKAAFIFKFPAFVEWPAGTFVRGDQPIVMGVLGDDAVEAELEQIAAAREGDARQMQVRRIGENGPFSGLHVLYVANRRESRLREIAESTPGPVLIVTDQPGGLRAGGVLNFSVEGGRVRFSASLVAAEMRQLRLSSRLLSLAQAVEGRPR